jgi:hypothetical protein
MATDAVAMEGGTESSQKRRFCGCTARAQLPILPTLVFVVVFGLAAMAVVLNVHRMETCTECIPSYGHPSPPYLPESPLPLPLSSPPPPRSHALCSRNASAGDSSPPSHAYHPIVCIEVTTVGLAQIPDEPKVQADIHVHADGQTLYRGLAGIERRGSSSQNFPKKGYGLETWDGDGSDMDVSLAGLPEEEDWVLHGPYSDKTLLRNVLAFDLVRSTGRYASRTRYSVLTINDDYKGIYLLMEKVKRDRHRVAVGKNNRPDDPSGGFLLKIDKPTAEVGAASSYSFHTGATRVLFEYPKAEHITASQRSYILGYVQGFEAALRSGNGSYTDWVDVGSFVDFFLITELARNVDGYRVSTYMYKDRNAKLAMGPYWDNNVGFGNANYAEGGLTSGWQWRFNSVCDCGRPGTALPSWDLVPFWWELLAKDAAFVSQVAARWSELRAVAWNTTQIVSMIDNYVALLGADEAIEAEFARWPTLGTYVWPNPSPLPTTYAGEIEALKNWIHARAAWLDGAFANASTVGMLLA